LIRFINGNYLMIGSQVGARSHVADHLDSELLKFISLNAATPGDRVPPLDVLSRELGLSVTKLREQLEVARQLGLVEVRPRSGIKSVEYNFLPAIRQSLLFGLALNGNLFKAYGELRNHTEAGFFKEAVARLTSADKEELRSLVAAAQQKLQGHPVRIPHQEHRQLHVGMFRRLENPFVIGLLEAYWEAYEAAELNVFSDYNYLERVWDFHARIVECICADQLDAGLALLVEHAQLLRDRV